MLFQNAQTKRLHLALKLGGKTCLLKPKVESANAGKEGSNSIWARLSVSSISGAAVLDAVSVLFYARYILVGKYAVGVPVAGHVLHFTIFNPAAKRPIRDSNYFSSITLTYSLLHRPKLTKPLSTFIRSPHANIQNLYKFVQEEGF
jgi:hypothetical protein